jgi:DNA-binding MarR family transcriptional regulator
VSASEPDVLLKLRHVETPMISRQPATNLGHSGVAVSTSLAMLERRGLVTREPNPTDRRAAFVRLTDEGTRIVDTLFPRQLGVEAALVRTDPERRAKIVEGLALLLETLEKSEAERT